MRRQQDGICMKQTGEQLNSTHMIQSIDPIYKWTHWLKIGTRDRIDKLFYLRWDSAEMSLIPSIRNKDIKEYLCNYLQAKRWFTNLISEVTSIRLRHFMQPTTQLPIVMLGPNHLRSHPKFLKSCMWDIFSLLGLANQIFFTVPLNSPKQGNPPCFK